MDYQSRIADDLGNNGPTVLFGSLCLIGFDSSIVVSLQSSSCLTPGPVSPGLFLPRSRPWLLSTAAERWFEVRSCKPTSRGRPSSVKQLRTLRSCKLRVLMAHCHRLPVNYYLMNIEARFYGHREPPGQGSNRETHPMSDQQDLKIVHSQMTSQTNSGHRWIEARGRACSRPLRLHAW
jgi:hypothetical protein